MREHHQFLTVLRRRTFHSLFPSLLVILLFSVNGSTVAAQAYSGCGNYKQDETTDTVPGRVKQYPSSPLAVKPLLVPAALISYGFIARGSGTLKKFDANVKAFVWTDHPHHPVTVDSYLQFSPALAVYALDAVGVNGINNFRDRTFIYLLSISMMSVTVKSLKTITREERPDGSDNDAFPSGHSATAFASAEFLHQEYKNFSPWISIAGYAAATTTAYLRLYNNRHWFRDIIPGAGIGILSTKISYWIYPSLKRIFSKNKNSNTVIMPYYMDKTAGMHLVMLLN